MTGWDVAVAPTIEIDVREAARCRAHRLLGRTAERGEPDVTASELAVLRAFDPDGVFIRDRA